MHPYNTFKTLFAWHIYYLHGMLDIIVIFIMYMKMKNKKCKVVHLMACLYNMTECHLNAVKLHIHMALSKFH